eukprot:3252579-Alexandrium_andersonii.AAC.1
MVVGKAVVRAVAENLAHEEIHPRDLVASPPVALPDLAPPVLGVRVLPEDRQRPRAAEGCSNRRKR